MPLVHGIGDEVVCAAIIAACPILFLARSVLLGGTRDLLKSGAALLWAFLGALWPRLRGQPVPPAGVGTQPAPLRAQGQQQRLLQSVANMDRPPDNEMCPVCFEAMAARIPCQANCSHWFCGDCILRVWQHSSALAPCKCPICRSSINLLIPSGAPVPPSTDGPGPQESERILDDISKYNRLFGGGPVSFWQRVRDMPLLLRRLAWELGDPRRAVRLLHNARILFCLILVVLYVVSPLDIISEWVLGIVGLLDDALLLVCVCFYLSILYRATLLMHHTRVHSD